MNRVHEPSNGPHQAECPAADDWRYRPAQGLEEAISRFKATLPGWWFSVCECQVSCDASCAPTRESPHIALVEPRNQFDDGFHADLPQPSTLADALYDVMRQALAALAAGQSASGSIRGRLDTPKPQDTPHA